MSEVSHKARDGREVWRIVETDGTVRTLITSASSIRAMERALRIYAGALQRLAKA